MSWRLPGRPSSISSTLRVPPSARVSTSCNTKPIHDPPAGNGPAGHIAPSAHPKSLDTPDVVRDLRQRLDAEAEERRWLTALLADQRVPPAPVNPPPAVPAS